MVGEVGDSHVIVYLPVTNVPGCIGSNPKTLWLQHLQFLDMGTSGGPPNGTRIVHHGTDELLIQQNTIPDGKIAFRVCEGPSNAVLNMTAPHQSFGRSGEMSNMCGLRFMDRLSDEGTSASFSSYSFTAVILGVKSCTGIDCSSNQIHRFQPLYHYPKPYGRRRIARWSCAYARFFLCFILFGLMD